MKCFTFSCLQLNGMLEAGTLIMQDFERTRLMPMDARVRKAIRRVDAPHLLFLEPAMPANLGIRSAIAPLVDDDGNRDPQQAYAPPVYDIVVDAAFFDLTGNNRIAPIVRRHCQFSRRAHILMLVGEWGAFYLNLAAAAPARYIARRFDAAGCGEMFWAQRRELANWAGLEALKRRSAGN